MIPVPPSPLLLSVLQPFAVAFNQYMEPSLEHPSDAEREEMERAVLAEELDDIREELGAAEATVDRLERRVVVYALARRAVSGGTQAI